MRDNIGMTKIGHRFLSLFTGVHLGTCVMTAMRQAHCCHYTFETMPRLIDLLTLWLQLADKLVQKTCLLGVDGRHIGPLDLTILPRMVDKSVKLIAHARHEWKINRPRDYQPLKDENLCLSILGLVHKREIYSPGSPL